MLKRLKLNDVTKTGEVSAEVATLDVIDKDGDVTRKGFFGKQDTKIVSGHDWSQIMLGKGVVSDEDGKKAVFAGVLNLDDPNGEQLHAKLRFDLEVPPPLIEWSYGFQVLDGGAKAGQFDGRDVQFLQPLPDGSPGAKVYEVSPVLVGAGEGTGTTSVKTSKDFVTDLLDAGLDPKELAALSAKYGFPWAQDQLFDVDEGKRFIDQLAGTVAAVEKALDRATAIAELRSSKTLGTATLERLSELTVDLGLLWEKAKAVAEARPDESNVDESFRLLQAQYESIVR